MIPDVVDGPLVRVGSQSMELEGRATLCRFLCAAHLCFEDSLDANDDRGVYRCGRFRSWNSGSPVKTNSSGLHTAGTALEYSMGPPDTPGGSRPRPCGCSASRYAFRVFRTASFAISVGDCAAPDDGPLAMRRPRAGPTAAAPSRHRHRRRRWCWEAVRLAGRVGRGSGTDGAAQ